ncbi:PD-(D/E)XK nuclease-like domain-containing protein [Psychrobacillus sp. NEAU-3TGS]|uniref:PD-(D/E)XK nuclease-like domain-containing protein n=1 Tax=Psychrobacillus sp. NEAU-3TGS TaxID=2995412 RepID=UPI002496AADF|nr:PD-(D/E)XK nuclease-like domain-containing protein [Psychrobacillus sp. NEAU-3TGS]MDI2588082.1 PD-(D/E)XK nuclease-like domain-containing protein [Psychrobacillus sp. NEAU-3TGS]
MEKQKLQLNSQNYHSNQANKDYFSVSQFKSFMDCQARTLAELKGEYTRPPSTALTVGSYTHAAFEDDEAFSEFLENEHDSIFKARGGKYAEFVQADMMIETIMNDPFAMFALEGDKERIFTAELFGATWKIKVDSINYERKTFIDLKTTQSLSSRYWSDKYQKYVSFVQAYDYVLQMAIYREVIKQNTGEYFNPYIVAVTKESPPDKAVLHFDNSRFDFELEYVQTMMNNFIQVKSGEEKPIRCEKCAYCRQTKVLNNTFEIEYLLD